MLQNDDFNLISKAVKVIERMVNQNSFDDVAQGSSLFHPLPCRRFKWLVFNMSEL